MKQRLDRYSVIDGLSDYDEWSYCEADGMWYEDDKEILPQPAEISEQVSNLVCEIKVDHSIYEYEDWEKSQAEGELENYARYIIGIDEDYDSILSSILLKTDEQCLLLGVLRYGIWPIENFIKKLRNQQYAAEYGEGCDCCKFIAWTDSNNITRFIIYAYSEFEDEKPERVFDITIDRESLIAKLENILKIWRETIYNAVKEQEKIIGKKAENPFSDNLINHFFPEFRTPVNRIIERELKCLEREHNITVLFAIESGSRAWNMASADSDYDVRFVFKRNIESYISLNKSHDVLEFYLDDEYRECKAESALIDGVGFDLRKYIELLSKSNPTSIEWLMSDIIYLGSNDLPIKEYVKENFNPQALIYHYMSWCRKPYKCIEDNKKVTYKKYLYALRGLLNALYVYKNNSIPFLDFAKTVESLKNYIPSSVYIIIKDIIKIKSQGYEKDVIDRIPMLGSFIKDYLNKDFTTPKGELDYKVLDTFMVKEILSQQSKTPPLPKLIKRSLQRSLQRLL